MTKRRIRAAVAVLALSLLAAACTSPGPSGVASSGCTGASDPAQATLGVAYGPNALNRANIYPACTTTAIGTIMYVHGGGYTSGSRSEGDWPAIRRFRDLGWVVVSIDYRLAPAYGYPAQVNDTRLAIDWWRGGAAASFGAPAAPLVGAGWSAGSQIADYVAVEDTGSKFDAVLSASGATDWVTRPPSTAATALFGLNPTTGLLAQASTTTHLDPSDPPLLHVHGQGDWIVPDSQEADLAAAILANGDPAKHATYLHPTCGHSHDCFDPTVVDPFLASIATL
jgi:acetyl esterase/lipase